MELKNSRILITGGSKGLGKAMAKLLKEAGAHVLITGRDEVSLKATADELGVAYLKANMEVEAEVDKLANESLKILGGIDVLINNAGIGGGWTTIDQLDRQALRKVYEINVFSVAMLTEKIAPIMMAQKSGTIVNIASTAATKGFARGTVYSSSKFALRGMTQCWQQELRPFNIRVILVNPSEVPTAFGSEERKEKETVEKKLTPVEIAFTVKACLEMDNRGYIPEVTVHATNPF